MAFRTGYTTKMKKSIMNGAIIIYRGIARFMSLRVSSALLFKEILLAAILSLLFCRVQTEFGTLVVYLIVNII